MRAPGFLLVLSTHTIGKDTGTIGYIISRQPEATQEEFPLVRSLPLTPNSFSFCHETLLVGEFPR